MMLSRNYSTQVVRLLFDKSDSFTKDDRLRTFEQRVVLLLNQLYLFSEQQVVLICDHLLGRLLNSLYASAILILCLHHLF